MTFDSWHNPGDLFFVTASICGWKPLFRESAYCQIILESLTWLREHKIMKLYAFVIMPTHLHLILYPINITISETLQKFGSYTAHKLLWQLRLGQNEEYLQFFAQHNCDRTQKYSIWQDIQAKNLFSNEVLFQKIEYIHNNPVSENWKLVEDRSDYVYSSAQFYDRGEQAVIPMDDVRELF